MANRDILFYWLDYNQIILNTDRFICIYFACLFIFVSCTVFDSMLLLVCFMLCIRHVSFKNYFYFKPKEKKNVLGCGYGRLLSSVSIPAYKSSAGMAPIESFNTLIKCNKTNKKNYICLGLFIHAISAQLIGLQAIINLMTILFDTILVNNMCCR